MMVGQLGRLMGRRWCLISMRGCRVCASGFEAGGLAGQFDLDDFAVGFQRLDLPVNRRQVQARRVLLGQCQDFWRAQGAAAASQGVLNRTPLAG